MVSDSLGIAVLESLKRVNGANRAKQSELDRTGDGTRQLEQRRAGDNGESSSKINGGREDSNKEDSGKLDDGKGNDRVGNGKKSKINIPKESLSLGLM